MMYEIVLTAIALTLVFFSAVGMITVFTMASIAVEKRRQGKRVAEIIKEGCELGETDDEDI